MGHVTGAELCAAVSNAGGIGTIGAIGMSPEVQRSAGSRPPSTRIDAVQTEQSTCIDSRLPDVNVRRESGPSAAGCTPC